MGIGRPIAMGNWLVTVKMRTAEYIGQICVYKGGLDGMGVVGSCGVV